MTRTSSDESRRYRILEVVGEGGFGMVYRARLEGAEGFAKDVAIKLLTDSSAPEEVLQRFRDESRILGLIRDRAIVTVDPPTRLDGRWAVVMEFVDGANCHRLLKAKPIPLRPALEIVQEVARALDNVYNQPGPTGEPLMLVHRDIKPSNIQITPGGSVKILDFGIARAEFTSREAKTTTAISGTYGYMAPERLEGINGAPGDIYSLGIVLVALICGRRPTPKNRKKIREWVDSNPDLQKIWALIDAMTDPDPDARPTAREVEDRCGELAGIMPGGSLRRWAEVEVSEVPMEREDDLLGSVLTETMAHLPVLGGESSLLLDERTRTRRRVGVVGLLAGGLGVALLAMSGALATGAYLALRPGTPDRRPMAVPVVVAPPEVPKVVEVPAPADVVDATADTDAAVDADAVAGTDADAAADPAPRAAPAPKVAPRPRGQAPKPDPRPPPTAATMTVTFGSVPLGAAVKVDGRSVGKAPLKHDLTVGRHKIEMEYAGSTASKTIQVGKRDAVKYIWRGGDEWQVFY